MSIPTQTVQYFTSPSRKLEAKETAHNRFKYGSPKLRDLLRQQYRVRLKDRRNNKFTGTRRLMEGIVKEGISHFEQDVRLQELIYKELEEEMEQWLIEETYYLSELDSLKEVICPLCQKRPLFQSACIICCDFCGFKTSQYRELDQLGDRIKLMVLEHEVKCPATIMFYAEPQSTDPLSLRINVICDECEYYAGI